MELGPIPDTRLSPSGIVIADGQAPRGIPIRISMSTVPAIGGANNVLTDELQRVGTELGDTNLGLLVEKAAINVNYMVEAIVPTQFFNADPTSAGQYEVAVYARVPTKTPVLVARQGVDVQDSLGEVQDNVTVCVPGQIGPLNTGSMGPSYVPGDDVEFYVTARIMSPNLTDSVRVVGFDDSANGTVSLKLIELSR